MENIDYEEDNKILKNKYNEDEDNNENYKSKYKKNNKIKYDKILEFTPEMIKERIKKSSFIFCASPRKSGKSYLIHWIIYNLRHYFQCGIVISPTSLLGQGMFKFIPDSYHYDLSPGSESFDEIINKIINLQKKRVENKKKMKQILLIIDDVFCASRGGGKKNVGRTSFTLSKMASIGRHYNCFMVAISQNIFNLTPSIRSQASFFISFYLRSFNAREMVVEQFLTREMSGSKKETRKKAENVLEQIWGESNDPEFKAVIVDLENSKSNKVVDNIFYIKAPPPPLPKFNIGCKELKKNKEK